MGEANNHIEEAAVREVDKFVYLGCELQKDGDIRNEINIRIGKASVAFRDLSRVWNENGISLRTKLKILKGLLFRY